MKKPIISARDICDISPEWLCKQSVAAVLTDLDNTLAGYGVTEPDTEILAWIKSLAEAGISLIIVSNAREERVAAFCNPLGLPYVAKAGKPHARGLLEAVQKLGVTVDKALMVGDQYFTDIKAGQNAGMRTVLVDPRVKGFLFSLRRLLETPFIRRHVAAAERVCGRETE